MSLTVQVCLLSVLFFACAGALGWAFFRLIWFIFTDDSFKPPSPQAGALLYFMERDIHDHHDS